MLYFMSAIRDLKMVTVGLQRQNVSDVSGNFKLPTIYASSNREAERRRKEQTIDANDYRLPHVTHALEAGGSRFCPYLFFANSAAKFGIHSHNLRTQLVCKF